jgi:hypothetical protein
VRFLVVIILTRQKGFVTNISVKPLPSGMGRKGDSPVAGDCLFRSVLVGSTRV